MLIPSLALLLALPQTLAAPKQTDFLVTARDEAGVLLGSLWYVRATSEQHYIRNSVVFVSSSGRKVAMHFSRLAGRSVALYDDGSSRLQLTFYNDFVNQPKVHTPLIFSAGDENLYLSLPTEPSLQEKALPGIQAEAARWVKLRAPGLFPVLREAYAWANDVLAVRPRPAFLMDMTAGGLWSLYYVFERKISRNVKLELGDDAERDRLRPEPSEMPPQMAAPRRERFAWKKQIVGGRDEPLGILHGGTQGFTRDVGLSAQALVLNVKRSAEKLTIAEVGPAGEFRVGLQVQAGQDWRTAMVFEGIAGGGGDQWFAPFVVQDLKGKRQAFEIPPAGEIPRRHVRRSILEALLGVLKTSRVVETDEEAAQLLWRWARVLSLAEATDSIPSLSGLRDILAELPPPSMPESQNAWLGAVRLAELEADGKER